MEEYISYISKNGFLKDRIWFVITPEAGDGTRGSARSFAKKPGFTDIRFIASGGDITMHGGPNAIGVAFELQ